MLSEDQVSIEEFNPSSKLRGVAFLSSHQLTTIVSRKLRSWSQSVNFSQKDPKRFCPLKRSSLFFIMLIVLAEGHLDLHNFPIVYLVNHPSLGSIISYSILQIQSSFSLNPT